MNYNEQLKKVRLALTLSQAEIAEKFGFTQSYYSALERGTKDISASVIEKLIKDFGVNPTWFYSSIGSIFINEKNPDNQSSKIGAIRKETFTDQLSKEDQNLITALKEIPELTEMLKFFVGKFDIDELEKLSSIGAVWIPGIKWDNSYEIKKDLTNEAYEMNMLALLNNLADYKKSIIGIWGNLIEVLKTVKQLDNKIKLPGKYLVQPT